MKKILAFVLLAMCLLPGLGLAKSAYVNPDYDFTALKTLGFKEVVLPKEAAGDTVAVMSVQYAMEQGAAKLKGVKLVYPGAEEPVEAYIRGEITRYEKVADWQDSYATTSIKSRTFTRNLKDKNGKDYKETVKDYWSKVDDHLGRWQFNCYVTATFDVVDAKTDKIILSYSDSKTDDKLADAYRDIVRGFYNQLDKNLKK